MEEQLTDRELWIYRKAYEAGQANAYLMLDIDWRQWLGKYRGDGMTMEEALVRDALSPPTCKDCKFWRKRLLKCGYTGKIREDHSCRAFREKL